MNVHDLLITLGATSKANRHTFERISRLTPYTSAKLPETERLPSPVLMACKTSHILCDLFSTAVRRILATKMASTTMQTQLKGSHLPYEQLLLSTLSSKVILSAHVNQIADRHLIKLCGTDVTKGLHIQNTNHTTKLFRYVRPLPPINDVLDQPDDALLNTKHLTAGNLRGCVNLVDRLCHAFVQESVNVFDTARVLFSHDVALTDKLDAYQDKMEGCYAAFYTSNRAVLSRKSLRPFKHIELELE